MQPWASSRTPTPESWCVLCVSCSHRCASQVACIVPVVYVSFMHAWTSARRRVSMMSDTCVCASSWILVAEVSSATSQTERDSVSLLLAVSLPSPCPSAPPNPPHPALTLSTRTRTHAHTHTRTHAHTHTCTHTRLVHGIGRRNAGGGGAGLPQSPVPLLTGQQTNDSRWPGPLKPRMSHPVRH